MKFIRSLFQRKHETEHKFQQVMKLCSARMLELSQTLVNNQTEQGILDKKLVNYLYIESSEVERVLDLAHAQGNRYWYLYRRVVAFLKNFSYGCSLLMSLRDKIKQMTLLKIEGNFVADTQRFLEETSFFLSAGCSYCTTEADKQEIYTLLSTNQKGLTMNTQKIDFILPQTRLVRHEHKTALTVISLASKFLGLSDKNEIFDCYSSSSDIPLLKNLVPRLFSAADVRMLHTHFHNMQSTYDTFLYGSDITHQNVNISVLYNHVMVIVQLLDLAAVGVHYYERHIHQKTDSCFIKCLDIVDPFKFLDSVVAYSLRYADRFRLVARGLCQDMIKQYAELGSIKTQVPLYRGFHVRPSTLIAKIVLHYGSDIKMKLEGVVYDAKMPLELFRANEELNAKKRRNLFALLAENEILQNPVRLIETQSIEKKRSLARDVILNMFEKKQIVVYDTDFSFTDLNDMEDENCFAFVKRVIARYMAIGKIDIQLETQVIFEGDKRVLQDIEILAEHGYGEDVYGNNIVLPIALNYLQRNSFS